MCVSVNEVTHACRLRVGYVCVYVNEVTRIHMCVFVNEVTREHIDS